MKDKNESIRILGLDIGTTASKCAAFDADFNVVAESHREYPLIHGKDNSVEQDPNSWWLAIIEAISEINLKSGSVKGIGISSQGITFVPVDKDGNHLMNAMTWLDMRAGEECRRLQDIFSDEVIFKTTGKKINPAYTLPKLMWIKSRKPEIYSKTFKFLMVHDYIINKLCGAFVTEDSMAAGTMAYDISRKNWDYGILSKAGIDMDKLPAIIGSGTIAGRLNEMAATELGLSTEIMVVAGGQDQKCAAYGAGLSHADITVSLGTSSAITSMYAKPVFLDDMSLPCFPFIDGKSWVLEGFGSTAGASVKWFRDNLGNGRSYKEIDSEIKKVYENNGLSDNVMFFPYLAGTGSPEWYDAKGGGFIGITMDTRNTLMAAAVLESVAFNIRANIEKMESIGKSFNGISVFGGGANSGIWLEIIADVTGKTVSVPAMEETACLGAAMKCAESLGLSDFYNPAKTKTIKPDKVKKKMYENKYRKYKVMENKIYGR